MFGALAATEALPFDRAAFKSAIRAGGTGVTSSLRAFAAAFDRTRQNPIEPVRRFPDKRFAAMPRTAGHPELDRLVARIRTTFPESVQPVLFAGVRRLVDYLDPDYALEYLDRVGMLFDIDRAHGGEARGFAFTRRRRQIRRGRDGLRRRCARRRPQDPANPARRACASK